MSLMIIWMLGIGLSVATLVLAAAFNSFYLHLVVAATVAIAVALGAFAEAQGAKESGHSSRGLELSTVVRHMGMVWTWSALGTIVTYGVGILVWREWWHFFLATFTMAGLSLFLSATLRGDTEAQTEDATMFKIARGYAIATLIAMPITMIGLLQQGKLGRFFTEAGHRIGSQDWAATNIYFFGALALTALAWKALLVLRQDDR